MSYYKMLYEKTSKAWKWWIEQQCPSGCKWVPKTKIEWVPKVRNENVKKRVSFAIDNASRITNVLKLTNTLGSNFLSIPSSFNSLADCLTHPIHCLLSMTQRQSGHSKAICNFVDKYLGTVRFGNDQFALILGYGDLVQGNITINRVYYVEGLNHNLFSIFIHLSSRNHFTQLYLFLAKASPNSRMVMALKGISHLNFDTSLLSNKDVVIGLPKLKYVKDKQCSSCEVSKAKRSSFRIKAVPSLKVWLNLLHMDLCGLMRVASINRKKYILVIIDDYSRYTWTLFLRSKDETPKDLKDFLTMIQQNLQAPIISVQTDRGTKFLNKTLNAFFKEEGIKHQTSTPRTPE
ncbi:retrovirus-related pol polyprotein from transposon TNT 1-94 [Tanacetum coccineum]|uniref:Retrovirus-related pol polyprotein from transposon TNT 1-94 n=1 Tax=Tanacetum coccineum TaxID=301880 RepID=A0ABQ5I8K7_9ASTR